MNSNFSQYHDKEDQKLNNFNLFYFQGEFFYHKKGEEKNGQKGSFSFSHLKRREGVPKVEVEFVIG